MGVKANKKTREAYCMYPYKTKFNIRTSDEKKSEKYQVIVLRYVAACVGKGIIAHHVPEIRRSWAQYRCEKHWAPPRTVCGKQTN